MIYEWRCEDCGHCYAMETGITLNPQPTDCPRCGSLDIVRVYDVPGVSFVGSGWYCKGE